MRIRTKKWARPELEACGYYIKDPKSLKGKWRDFFGNDNPIYLDLGCGKCTFLAQTAYQHKDINYIAVDISMDILGVGRRNVVEVYGEEDIKNIALCSYNIEQITDLFMYEDNISRIYINFCNPWPSSKCHKRRLTHTRQLEDYKKILQNKGEVWFKTDNDDLYISSKRYFKESGFDIFFTTSDLDKEDVENVKSEHEVMFESQGIKTKAIRATKP